MFFTPSSTSTTQDLKEAREKISDLKRQLAEARSRGVAAIDAGQAAVPDDWMTPDAAKAKANNVGEVLYNRAILNAVFATEAVRKAAKAKGGTPTGADVRKALETFSIDKARLKALGLAGFANPVSVSCKNHEGTSPGVFIQQWTGTAWKVQGGFVPAMSDVVRPLVEKAAAAYAKENKIKPASC